MSTRPHLLVVDDDREIRALLARYLERNDFRVSTARNCVEARQVWERGHYQLAVLDLMLPERVVSTSRNGCAGKMTRCQLSSSPRWEMRPTAF